MADFKNFTVWEDTAKNISDALDYCKANGERKLVFPKGTYNIKADYAPERWLSISNHGKGLKRIAFLLEGFRNFIIDLSGSTIVLEDVMIAFALIGCENVHIKNFTLKSLKPLTASGVITDVTDNGFSFKLTGGSPVRIENGRLISGEANGYSDRLCWINEWRKEDGRISEKYSDTGLTNYKYVQTAENEFQAERVVETAVIPTLGNSISIQHSTRYVCGILVDGSVNTKISNYTIYSGIGMGVLAQNSDTVTIDTMKVLIGEGSCFSINADATHFVHCKGLIHITNSYFEGQLDDALNVHGIYLRIVEKHENSLILKFMHPEATGIDCVKEGSVMETCDSLSLIPKKCYTVSGVKKLNSEYIEVFFRDDISDVEIGDDMTEVSYVCDVLFDKNTVTNNRARGMLIAATGKTVITENIFDTPGAAIKFESDGAYWFESGGTKDVIISKNEFTNCLYVNGAWGSRGIIDVMKRSKTEEGKYFHKRIEISDNVFKDCTKPLASINNTELLVVKNNKTVNCTGSDMILEYIGKVEE